MKQITEINSIIKQRKTRNTEGRTKLENKSLDTYAPGYK